MRRRPSWRHADFRPAGAAGAASGSRLARGDTFVFHPGMGAETINDFDPNHETIALDQFAGAQTLQQLQTLITHDAHAMIELCTTPSPFV